MSPGRAAAPDSTGADDRIELGSYDWTQSTALVRRIEGAVNVELSVLALLLDGDYDVCGRVWFRCPIHQSTSSALIRSGPAATTIGALSWRCDTCRHTGTLWSLRRAALENGYLLGRLLDNLGIEVAS